MADKLPSGFLSKPEALEKYQKPERTFQRRLATALKVRDEGFLSHFYLVTSDGKIRKGTEVEAGQVEQLKTLYPIWHLEEHWFANEYDNKAKSKASGKVPKPAAPAAKPAPVIDRSSLDRQALVAEVASLHRELESEKEHNKLITAQLDIKDEQIKAANSLSLKSNEREKEHAALLKEIAERLPRLPTGDTKPEQIGAKPTNVESAKAPQQATPIDTEVVDAPTAPNQKQRKQPASKKKARPSEKPKWYETPTLRRFLSH